MVDAWVKREERAELVVRGAVFSEWESVTAELSIGDEPSYHFSFTVSEVQPFAESLAVLRIRPGDSFTLFLAGHLVMTGFVTTRNVYFDATQHTVNLTGVSFSHQIALGAAITPTGQFHGQGLQQMAQQLLGPMGIGMTLLGDQIGQVLMDKFPRAAINPGETVHAFLERYARPLGAHISSDEFGNLVFIAGQMGGTAAVIEAQNILIGREEISVQNTNPNDVGATGASPGANEQNGPDINSLLGQASPLASFGGGGVAKGILSEIPAWTKKLLEGRSKTETQHDAMETIIVTVVVYGWEYTPGALWFRGQSVHVKSPMLMMDEPLTARKVTFTQDSASGSRTTLELVNPLGLGHLPDDVGEQPPQFGPQPRVQGPVTRQGAQPIQPPPLRRGRR
jgi:prophage tail gpP-like protein